MAVYFISDLHLDDHRPDLLAAFSLYLKKIQVDAEALYILGDFFEAWIGDDDDAEWIAPLVKQLADFSSQVKCYFCHGNRDFLVGPGLAQRCGFTLLPQESTLNYEGRSYLLAHGDSYCTDDVQYQGFRQLLRSPQWQEEMLGKPLAERRLMAQALRNNSKAAQREKASDITDVNAAAIEQAISQNQADILIHGHTHRPKVHQIALADGRTAQRMVLGDWDEQGWHIRLDQNGAILESWPISS